MTDFEGRPDQIHICRTCGRVLDHHTRTGWQHSFVDEPADHPADPVAAGGEVPTKARCDFCSQENPEFVLPAADFEVMRDHVSRGDWAACRDCAVLIEQDLWGQVVQRVAQTHYRREGRVMPHRTRTSISVMYHLLRENIRGHVVPIPGADPLVIPPKGEQPPSDPQDDVQGRAVTWNRNKNAKKKRKSRVSDAEPGDADRVGVEEATP